MAIWFVSSVYKRGGVKVIWPSGYSKNGWALMLLC